MSRRAKLIAIAIAAVVIVTVLAIALREPPAHEPPTVRIGYLNIVASLPLFVAEEKGFLQAEGIKYETTPIASSNQLVDAIVAGNLDVFPESSAIPVLAVELQSAGRMKVFAVSEITGDAPFDSLLVRDDSDIKQLPDLAGRKVAVYPGSTATALLKDYLGRKGIDVSKVTFIPMPPQNHIAALVEGSVDAVHAYEPTTAIALTRGGIRKLYGSVYADMLSPNPQGVAAIRTDFIANHPEQAAKVIRALERAMVFMRENDSETRNVLVKRMQLSDDAAKRTVFLYMLPHSKIDGSVFQRYADMLTSLGELKGHVKVDSLLYRE